MLKKTKMCTRKFLTDRKKFKTFILKILSQEQMPSVVNRIGREIRNHSAVFINDHLSLGPKEHLRDRFNEMNFLEMVVRELCENKSRGR